MIYILLSVILGSFLTLLLVAPSEYYLSLLILPLVGIIITYIFKRFIVKPSKYILISLPVFFVISYIVTSCMVFIPKKPELLNVDPSTLSNDKKAIILYTNGEMEKYSLNFASFDLEDTSYILKPIESFKIKKAYKSIGESKKNLEIIKISRDFRESLLKNSPCQFYIAYSNYKPSLIESINYALVDKSKDISIINLTNKEIDYMDLNNIKNSLSNLKVNFKVSKPILNSLNSKFILEDIKESLGRFNSFLILGNNEIGSSIKTEMEKLSINKENIVSTENINEGLEYINALNIDNKNTLVINLLDFQNGLLEKYTIPNAFKEYKVNYTIFNPLKYNKDFLEILVNEYKSLNK